jgi:hypothetical protein
MKERSWGATTTNLKKRHITRIVLGLLIISVIMTLVSVGTLNQSGEKITLPSPNQIGTNPTRQTLRPLPSASPKNPIIQATSILLTLPQSPTFKTVTILSSIGGSTEPPEGTYTQIENLEIVVTADKGYLFSCWEITADGNTWTEPPWNPCAVIYDGCTVQPLFTYIVADPSSTPTPTPTPTPPPSPPSTPTPTPTPSPSPTPPATIPITFGNTAIGTYVDQNDANAQSVSYFTATTNGTITDIVAYIDGASKGNCIAALYSVNQGSAGALLAQSNPVSIGTAFSWVDFQLSTPYNITTGTTYGLAIMGNVPVNVMGINGTGQRDHNAVTSYANGFANPFGPIWVTDDRGAISIYATGTSST